jgi:hypothetical protein
MAFRIGQKVVCVDDSCEAPGTVCTMPSGHQFVIRCSDLDGLTKGTIYTVAAVKRWHGEVDLVLSEIKRTRDDDGDPEGFRATRFRPVQERKQSTETGMSILRSLLKSERVDA